MIRSLLFISVILVFLLAACGHSDSDTFIISKNDSLSKVSLDDSTVVIVPPKVKYAAYTFIIDSTGNFYFYCMPEERPHSFFDGDEPEYIGLQPNRVFSIPKGAEREFFDKNVLYQKSSRNIKTIMVASYKDTINSAFLMHLIELSKKVKESKIWTTVRLALPEEHAVIKSKINGLYYEPKF